MVDCPNLDMSLDDIIRAKKQKLSNNNNNTRLFHNNNKQPIIQNKHNSNFNVVSNQPHNQQMVVIGGPGTEGWKLYVSNLDYDVSNEDLKVLFSDVGKLKRNSINYDQNGKSKGTAVVVYESQADALAALKRYNNVPLDGKPMQLELVSGVNLIAAAPMPPITGSILGQPNGKIGRQDDISGKGEDCGMVVSAGPGPVRGRGQGKAHSQKISAESLDADLEEYHREATKRNKFQKRATKTN